MHAHVANGSEFLGLICRMLIMKGLSTFGRAIDKGIQEDEIARSIILTEASAATCGQYVCASLLMKCSNVGSIVDLRRI